MHFNSIMTPTIIKRAGEAIGLQIHGESLPIIPVLIHSQPFLKLQLNPNSFLLGKLGYYNQFLRDTGDIWIKTSKIKLTCTLNFLSCHWLLYDPFMSKLLLKFNWKFLNIKFLLSATWLHWNILQCVHRKAGDKRKMMDQRRGTILTVFSWSAQHHYLLHRVLSHRSYWSALQWTSHLLLSPHLPCREYCTKLSHLLPEIKPDVISSMNPLYTSSFLFNEIFAEPFLRLQSPENDSGHSGLSLKTWIFCFVNKTSNEEGNAAFRGEKVSLTTGGY